MISLGSKEHFENSVKNHELKILHDSGLYRYLIIANPQNNNMYYEVVTYPGHLVISGDMGSCTFSIIPDMFDFFRTENLSINLGYWNEKAVSKSIFGENLEYDNEAFSRLLERWLEEWVEEESPSKEEKEEVKEEIKDAVFLVDTEEQAFNFLYDVDEDSPLAKILDQDFWEYANFKKSTGYQEWRLYAINHAIRLYDAVKRNDALVLPSIDKEISVFKKEFVLLRKIAETSRDLIEGKSYPEFRDACGGQDVLDKKHLSAVIDYRNWLADGDA